MIVNVLGTPYEIVEKKYNEDESFEKDGCDGYCNFWDRQIIICDLYTTERWKNEKETTVNNASKAALRHEIVHAFLYESGLAFNSSEGGQWAINEEIVDWIAIQGEKIHKAWKEVDAL